MDDDRDRIRAAYDRVADDYARVLAEHLDEKPLERALLASFAEQVLAGGGGTVLDAGCGPGRLTSHLHDLGLDVAGVDLSPAMVDVARRTHPHLRFDVADLAELPQADGELAGVVAWYSIIHVPPTDVPVILAELHRVLRPGGLLLLAFQAGHDEVHHVTSAYGHDGLDVDAHRLDPDRIAALAFDIGFVERHRTLAHPEADEPTPQAYLLLQRPAEP